MSARGRQLSRRGRRLRRARLRQAPGDAGGAVDLGAAGGPRRSGARRLPWGARVRVRAGRAHARAGARGPRDEVDDRPRRARAAGRQPLRRGRLRRGRRDPQRPRLRGRAAARRQRLLRHRRFELVRAPGALHGAAGGLAAGLRGRRLRVGRRGVADAPRDALRAARSSSPGPPSAPSPTGRRRSSAAGCGTATRSCSWHSSGLHANGASLARLVAERLPEGFATPLPDGRRFGEALLDPSVMYVGLVAELLAEGVAVSYLSHVTGHGLLKLMRPSALLHVPHRRPARGPAGARASWPPRPRHGPAPRPTRPSTWGWAMPSTAPPGVAGRCSACRRAGPRSAARGSRRGGSAAGDPRAARGELRRLARWSCRCPERERAASTSAGRPRSGKWRFKVEGCG